MTGSRLKVKIGSTDKRRLAGDMAMRNDLAFNQEVVTQMIRHTNAASPLIFFGNIMGDSGQGSEDGMFEVESRGISSEFLRVDEYKTGFKRPLRVLDNSKLPDTIYANTAYDIEVDTPIDEDENLLLRDQESMITVRSVRVGTTVTLTFELLGTTGQSVSKKLFAQNSPLNVGYGNSKGEASPNGNTLTTSETTRNSFYNPLVITRYVFTATGSYLSNREVFSGTITNDKGDAADFAIDLPVEFFRQVLSSLENQMLYSVGNFNIETLEVLGKARTTRYSDRPQYLGIYQQLDDIQLILTHSLSTETEKAGIQKIDSLLRAIKGMTGGEPVVAAICSGVGAEWLRWILKAQVNAGGPIQYQQIVGTDNEIKVGFRVNQYMSDHGTLIIYDMGSAMLDKKSGRQFDQITFNGISSDLRSRNIYFVPISRTSKGKRVKRAQYFYKEGQVTGFGKTSRAFVFGKTKGMSGEDNKITMDQLMSSQEDAIRQMMNSSGNRIDSTIDGNEYHALSQGTPYINADDSARLVLGK